MTISKYQKKRKDTLKAQAVRLYKSGLTFREVSKVLKVSHEWVRLAYLSTLPTEKV